jgi:hypothetical protein
MEENMWGYQETSGYQQGMDLTGFKVEASDGDIGKVDKHSQDVDAAHIVVDTGMWIFGKQVLLPVGTISHIDVAERRIHIDRTQGEIKDAPEFDKDKHTGDSGYHEQVSGYYGKPRN